MLLGTPRVVSSVLDQESFETLFKLLFSNDRAVAMRAADAIEKVSRTRPEFLQGHQEELLNLLKGATNNELKWHLAQIICRIDLSPDDLRNVWNLLNYWATNPNEAKSVRVHALQGLYDLALKSEGAGWRESFKRTLSSAVRQRIPSLAARARKLLTNLKD
jgi:hypothetical protein